MQKFHCATARAASKQKVLPMKQLNYQTSLDLVFKRQVVQKVERTNQFFQCHATIWGDATNRNFCPATQVQQEQTYRKSIQTLLA